MNKKVILLSIDGFGIGEMKDVATNRPQDKGAHTLKNILKVLPQTKLPNFKEMGFLDYYLDNSFTPCMFHGFQMSYGKINLVHMGADSYLGHNEMAGTKPKAPIKQFVRFEKDAIMKRLNEEGFKTEFKNNIILVEEHIGIADNIEADYGLNINVIGSLDHFPFETIERVGRIVRSVVKTGRVNTMGGTNISQDNFFDCLEERKSGDIVAWGINIPKLGVFNDTYQVIHMGYGIDFQTQTPQILLNHNIPVTLIGKAADVIVAKGAKYRPQVYTDTVIKFILEESKHMKNGLIFANIQETDLSGHEQNVPRYAKYLEQIDTVIPLILNTLSQNDLLIISGDHGNDPTIGHPMHTREMTPLVLFSKKIPAKDLGERETLADIGASIAAYFQTENPQAGISFI